MARRKAGSPSFPVTRENGAENAFHCISLRFISFIAFHFISFHFKSGMTPEMK
jgi:hypothetical protein